MSRPLSDQFKAKRLWVGVGRRADPDPPARRARIDSDTATATATATATSSSSSSSSSSSFGSEFTYYLGGAMRFFADSAGKEACGEGTDELAGSGTTFIVSAPEGAAAAKAIIAAVICTAKDWI